MRTSRKEKTATSDNEGRSAISGAIGANGVDKPVDEDRKRRVAIGVFDDMVSLRSALEGIRASGLEVGPPSVVANEAAFSGQLEASFYHHRHPEPRCTTRIVVHGDALYPRLQHGEPIRAQSMPVAVLRILQFADWMTPKFANDLNERLAEGHCFLAVPITTAREERMMYQILLNHSDGPVQLHDFEELS